MRKKREANSDSLRRGLVAVTVAGGIGMMLVAFALAFSNAASARQIAESSQELQWANATAGSAAVTRLAMSQALVFTIDHELHRASAAAAETTRDEAAASLDVLAAFAASAPAAGRGAAQDVETLVKLGRTALLQMERGDIRDADATLALEFEPTYVTANQVLHEEQQTQAARIDNAASSAGRTENITRLIVTLLIPGAAIIIHQLIMRRQYREREVHMEAQVEAERELNRSKDGFIAGISHELRTPLTSIYGFSEYLLENGLIDPTESLELITMINDDSAELSRMVDDLLAAARIDANAISYEIMPLEIKGEVEHLVDQIRRTGAKVNVVGARTIGLADRSRLRQILRNLISNAEHHGGDEIEVDVSVFNGFAAIRVIDNGDGVGPDMEGRLFTRFVHDGTTTLTSGSVGLGLAIAHQMAHDMGGDITYERTLGLTLFTVLLPLAPVDALPVPPTAVPEAEIYTQDTATSSESEAKEEPSIPDPFGSKTAEAPEAVFSHEHMVVFE
ncbi:MAG: HAMP domain-containing histidine kinase [bacterium]|nr:HAMP domain-containing histidine kinase [bacterium]